MANTPSAIKRVRQTARKRAINQPRRSAAKTLVGKAVSAATAGDTQAASLAMVEAVSALDRAAKSGAIHRNAAARRKSRLMLKMNAALGGENLVGAAKPARATGKAAAAKAAKARVAASKADKAKGEQTAAGKARAALTRSTRGDAATTPSSTTAPEQSTTTTRTRATGAKSATKSSTTKKAPASGTADAAAATKTGSTPKGTTRSRATKKEDAGS